MSVQRVSERAYFVSCLALGRLLRAVRYSKVRIVSEDGEPRVRKRRRSLAPLLVRMGGLMHGMLESGVRLLPQRDWEARERELYAQLHDASIRIDADGTLVLPLLTGRTLAALLDDPALEEAKRTKAIEQAVVALGELHRLGVTHGDAMAENVMVDLDAGVARWFDFETVHDSRRPMAWRRADDVRALLATCLLRTAPEKLGETLQRVLDVYADQEIVRALATSFASSFRRPLAFHLGQAGLSCRTFREIVQLLTEHVGRIDRVGQN